MTNRPYRMRIVKTLENRADARSHCQDERALRQLKKIRIAHHKGYDINILGLKVRWPEKIPSYA